MKFKFTSLKLLTVLLLLSFSVFAQTPYRSAVINGDWGTVASWESFNGSSWVPASATPTSTDGAITILAGHNIRLTPAQTADEITVDAGGTLLIDVLIADPGVNNLTLNNGPGTDLIINGHLLLTGNNIINGTGSVEINGTMEWRSGTIQATTTTGPNSVTTIYNDFIKRISTTFTNNGVINWGTVVGPGNNGIRFNNGTFINNNIINEEFTTGRGFSNEAGTNSFVNNGRINKTTTNTFFNLTVPFTNNGRLNGIGRYELTGTVVNTDTLSPGIGTDPGILSVTDNLVEPPQTPTLWLEIYNNGGAGAVNGHDRLDFTATVDVTNANLFVVADDNAASTTYDIMFTSSGVFSGTFASVLIPQGYTLNYTPGVSTTISVTKNVVTLPVVWGDFTALAKNNQVKLNWSTLQEMNTSHFVVEYSIDGTNFSPIATLPAAGNSSVKSDYSFVHTSPTLNRNNFYRIQQVDIDNRKTNTAIRTVRFSDGNVVKLLATPNPVRDVLQLTVQAEGISVRLIDLNGRSLKTMNLQSGVQPMNVQDLSSGIYQLVIYQDNKQIGSQRIVKQ